MTLTMHIIYKNIFFSSSFKLDNCTLLLTRSFLYDGLLNYKTYILNFNQIIKKLTIA